MLSEFGAKFIKEAANFIETIGSEEQREIRKMDSLVHKLYEILNVK